MFTTIFTDSFFYLLLAVNASVICLFLIAKVRKLQFDIENLKANSRTEATHSTKNIHGILGRLKLVEGQLETVLQKQDQLRTSKPVETNFSQASKLLDLGVDSQQLAQGFGLSEAEANLISLIHEKQDSIEGNKSLDEVA